MISNKRHRLNQVESIICLMAMGQNSFTLVNNPKAIGLPCHPQKATCLFIIIVASLVLAVLPRAESLVPFDNYKTSGETKSGKHHFKWQNATSLVFQPMAEHTSSFSLLQIMYIGRIGVGVRSISASLMNCSPPVQGWSHAWIQQKKH